MADEKCCACSTAPKLIFPCSGGSDVGEITDRAARQLTADGVGKMYCLAGIGGRVSGIMASTASAGRVLAIDGCPLDCAKNALQQAGFSDFEHLRLADLGLLKGQSPATPENLEKVVLEGASALLR